MTFSNYVHAKYPEVMDMFGGEPSQFHVGGMDSSRKDRENIAIIETNESTVSNSLAGIVQTLNLESIIAKDQVLLQWYSSVVA